MSNDDMLWVKGKGEAFGKAYVPYSSHERLMIDKDQQLTTLRAEVERLSFNNETLRKALKNDARDFADRIELLEGLLSRAQPLIDPCFPIKCHEWQKDTRAALAQEKPNVE